MRPLACLLAALAFAPPAAVRAEGGSPLVLTALKPPSPCGFFRSQAYGRGIDDQATEMLWACEAITARRAADMPLGIRLEATELALQRYRDALHAATRDGFASAAGRGPTSTVPSNSEKRAIAERTGISAALMAISGGY